MKLPRLSEIDLANNAARPPAEKRKALEEIAAKGGWGYGPVRDQNFNIFHPKDPMGLAERTPLLSNIIRELEKSCKYVDQLNACIEVANAIWFWRKDEVGQAVERPLPGMPIGALGVVRFWVNFVAIYNGRPTFFFFDYRRGNGLTALGRCVGFSLMHEHIRTTYPEFANAQLAIVQMPANSRGKRKLSVHTDEDVDLYSLAQLQAMVTDTYAVWEDVQISRRTAPAKKAAGGSLL